MEFNHVALSGIMWSVIMLGGVELCGVELCGVVCHTKRPGMPHIIGCFVSKILLFPKTNNDR